MPCRSSNPEGQRNAEAREELIEAGLAKEIKAKPGAPVWRRDEQAGQSYVRDTMGRPIGLDIETAASPAERTRLKALTLSFADAKGKLDGLREAKASAPDIKAAAKRVKTVAAHRKMAGQAALDPHRSSIRLVQLYGGGDKVYVVDIARTGQGALRLLNGLTIVAHNAQFELAHLEHAGVGLDRVHCTLQAARLLLGERRMSLADAAADFLDVALDKVEQAGDWGAPNLTRSQLEYAASDAVAVFRLAQKCCRRLAARCRPMKSSYPLSPPSPAWSCVASGSMSRRTVASLKTWSARFARLKRLTSLPAALARTSPTQTYRRRRGKRSACLRPCCRRMN
jgi:ribonuclease D